MLSGTDSKRDSASPRSTIWLAPECPNGSACVALIFHVLFRLEQLPGNAVWPALIASVRPHCRPVLQNGPQWMTSTEFSTELVVQWKSLSRCQDKQCMYAYMDH